MFIQVNILNLVVWHKNSKNLKKKKFCRKSKCYYNFKTVRLTGKCFKAKHPLKRKNNLFIFAATKKYKNTTQ